MKTWGNTKRAVVAAAALGIAFSTLGGAGPAGAAPAKGATAATATAAAAATEAEAAAPVVVARYTFDSAASGADGATITDDSGHGHTLTSSAGHGGKVRLANLASRLATANGAAANGAAG